MALCDDLKLALDPVLFSRRMLDFEPDPWQANVLRSDSGRKLFNCARQSGKSTTAAILTLHTTLYRPGSLVLLVSPSLRQSSELFRTFRGLLGRLPNRPALPEDNRLSAVLENGSRVVSLPGSEAKIRGFSSVDLLIEDEAARVDDALYYSTRPMLAVSGGRLILMSTPFGKRGHFFEAWSTSNGAWEKVRIMAHECPRITEAFLAEEREAIGDWWFKQEYQCEFLDAQSAAFTYEMLEAAQCEEVEAWAL